MVKVKNQRILVIINPSSGVSNKDIAVSVLFKKLKEHFTNVAIINSISPANGFHIAEKAKKEFDIIAAFGGDGTINSVASALVGSDTPLGILPGGSGNGLARNLKIPLSWRRAIDILIYGHDVKIDIGQLNDKFFFNVAGIGLDGLVAKKFEMESKSRGITPYIYHALKGFFEMETFRVNFTLDNAEFQDQVIILAFANFRQYGGKLIIAPFADPFDEQLDLCIINKFKLLEHTGKLQRVFTGKIHKFPFYQTRKFSNLKVTALDGPIPCTIDGEYQEQETFEFEVKVLPARLTVRIPIPK